jgi:basic membrane protein A
MAVRYTNSWYDENAEKTIATTLIYEDNAVLISQHADSQGAPSVCEAKKVPNVFYNGSNDDLKDSYLTSSRINWRPFFRYFIQSTLEGKKMDADWTGTIANGAVEVYPVNTKIAAEGTQAAMDKAIADFKAGKLHVFDTTKFTINDLKGDGVKTLYNLNAVKDAEGHVTAVTADVDDLGDYVGETEVIADGYFHESEFRSAPYFDLIIDGITLK